MQRKLRSQGPNEPQLAKDKKGSQRGFCQCVCSKSWAREWVSLLLSGKEKLSEDGSEKAEVPNDFFISSVLPERVSCSQHALRKEGRNRFECLAEPGGIQLWIEKTGLSDFSAISDNLWKSVEDKWGLRRLQKRKLNGISFKKGEREELWAGKPVMPREYFSGKYDKDDEVVSKHVKKAAIPGRGGAASAASLSAHIWKTHLWSQLLCRSCQAETGTSTAKFRTWIRGSEIIEKVWKSGFQLSSAKQIRHEL